MLSPRKHRVLSALLLATYVVASSASGLWHRHGEVACPSSVSRCDHHHDHTCDSQAVADAQSRGPARGASVSASQQHDDCAVCRFLAQRVVSVAPPVIEDRGTLATLLSMTGPDRPSPGLGRTTQARAPPSVG